MNLKEKTTEWNGGIERGAAARLAREMDEAANVVSLWFSGTTRPSEEKIPKLAKIFGITMQSMLVILAETKQRAGGASIVREAGVLPERSSGYKFLEIPFLGTVRADRFAFSFDLPPENFTTLAIKGSAGDRYAMLRISGDCMSPTICEGDEVLIRETSHVEDGAIAVVCFDGECTLKRIYKKKDGVQLKADNKAYEPRLITSNKMHVLAEVVKIIKDPRRKP
ncbi:MAG: XRE family transcriptional regulator [Elusimicrobia bacterium]|nr:XRE family transcriptional regulator [Elusimicrobiota bacterium]